MQFQAIYNEKDLLAINKPAGLIVFPEGNIKEKTLIDYLLEIYPELKNCGKAPRYGIIHRLDKDTSGILLIAKNDKALIFFQKQFKTRTVIKTYIALVNGVMKENSGIVKGLMGRGQDGKKQILLPGIIKKPGLRESKTLWKVFKRFDGHTLIFARPKTGRKHQIRLHLSSIGHPITGDTMYSFKNSSVPKGLYRQFLHSFKIQIKNMDGSNLSLIAPLPEELKTILNNLKTYETD